MTIVPKILKWLHVHEGMKQNATFVLCVASFPDLKLYTVMYFCCLLKGNQGHEIGIEPTDLEWYPAQHRRGSV